MRLYSQDAILNNTIEILEEALDADPGALHALMCNRVPCNDKLGDHPHITVAPTRVVHHKDPESIHVGTLGLINGILGRLTGKKIHMTFTEGDGDSSELTGFAVHATDNTTH